MKIYAITIKPESSFGTPLKGDTIFGHFCWQVAHDSALLNGGLDTWIDRYPEQPFAVFSSAWPQLIDSKGNASFCLPRPTMPVSRPADLNRKQQVERRKKDKKKKWLLVQQDKLNNLISCPNIDDKELFIRHRDTLGKDEQHSIKFLHKSQQKPILFAQQAHNSINRLTMTTGKGFDPFNMENFHYLPGLELVIFAALEEEALQVKELEVGLERIGKFGFGRDASIGLGRFSLGEIEEMQWPRIAAGQGCYVLAPFVPEEDRYTEQFALPFTRFGRHGDRLVLSENPFKNPVVMADEGAVFFPMPGKEPDKPYIGQAVAGLSLVEKRTVAQGYALYLPIERRTA